MGSSNAGTKFVVNFSVEGSGEDDLKRIAGLFKGLGGTSGGISDGTKGMNELGVQTMVTVDAFEKLAEVGEHVINVGQAGLRTYTGVVSMMMEQLSPIESSMIRLMSVAKQTKEQAMETLHMAQDLVIFTPFEEAQVVKMMEFLGASKVSLAAFNDEKGKAITLSDAAAKGFANVSENALNMAGSMKMTAATAIADFAAATGQVGFAMETFTRGMQRALATGNLMMLKDQVSPQALKAIFETTGSKAKIPAQKMIHNLFDYIKKEQMIGASVMASDTFVGIQSNFKDIPLKFAQALGGMPGTGGFYDQFKNAFAKLFADIFSGIKDENFMGAVRKAFEPTFNMMLKGLGLLGKGIKSVMAFVKDNPTLVKFATTLGFIASGLAVVGGALLVVTGSVAALSAALTAIGSAAIIGAIAMVGKALLVLTGVLAAGLVLYQAWKADLGGIRTFFENIKVVIDALQEAWANWAGTSYALTEETAKKLEATGLMKWFETGIVLIRKVQVFWEGFSRAIEQRWDAISEKFGHAWNTLSKAFGELKDAVTAIVDVLFGGVDKGNDAMDEMTDKGAEWGDVAADALETMADFAQGVADWFSTAIGLAPDVILIFADIYENVMNITTAVFLIVDAFKIVWHEMHIVGLVLMQIFTAFYDMLVGIISAVGKLGSGDFKGAGEALRHGWDTGKIGEMDKFIEQAQIDQAAAMEKMAGRDLSGAESKATADKFRQRAYDMMVSDGPVEEKKGPPAPSMSMPGSGEAMSSMDSPEALEWARRRHGEADRDRRLGQQPLNLKGDVMLDSEKIGDVLWKKFEAKMERAGIPIG